MSGNKRKSYLSDSNKQVTKYAKGQMRKSLQMKESLQSTNKNEVPSTDVNVEFTNDNGPEYLQQFENGEIDNNSEMINHISMLFQEVKARVDVDYDKFEEWYSSDDEITELLTTEVTLSITIINLTKNDEFFKPVALNAIVSSAELLLMIFKYSMKNHLSRTGISNLLKLTNCMFGKTVLPESRYKIDQLCKPANDIELHSVCYSCSNYIGTFKEFNTCVFCSNCNTEVDLSHPSNPCYFAIIHPSEAICEYLEMHENYYFPVVNERRHQKDCIEDIYDGKLYRQFVKNLSAVDRYAYATVIFITDGAPVFKSFSFSIWPIYIILNELPQQERLNSAITVGLWFRRSKPEMTIF
ncbi:uncharacterized protein LOC116417050 [Nasonia vitripennis]|uniref:Uncharacterized protein n=1 Tax=Nasonia vitripennis TaxID=7425 RepID=A0A7M7Q9N3_NASVI|nr:uncharacterized protein LOC116417050 [Nasonia vitripennis]